MHDASTVEEWTSILNLAVKWDFASIRTLAIKELALIASPIDKVVLGREHDITSWLADAYRAVCERPEALSEEEGTRLGMPEAMKIAKAREEMRIVSGFVDASKVSAIIERTVGLEERAKLGGDSPPSSTDDIVESLPSDQQSRVDDPCTPGAAPAPLNDDMPASNAVYSGLWGWGTELSKPSVDPAMTASPDAEGIVCRGCTGCHIPSAIVGLCHCACMRCQNTRTHYAEEQERPKGKKGKKGKK